MSIEQPVALGVPLTGVQLIEASAGTGKTWTLSGIFLRLVVETDVAIGGILAVTFTRAATAELRERIRRRLAAMLDLL
ncbi:MAG: UvrD-helicase domain-containing protein, partial [Gammaproteobacteria bacterium]